MDNNDIKRKQIQDLLFGDSSNEKAGMMEENNFMSKKTNIENDLYTTLEKYGYHRQQLVPIVANVLAYLSKFK